MMDFFYSNSFFFFYSFLIGLIIGIIYDIFRILRIFVKNDAKVLAPEKYKKFTPFLFPGEKTEKIGKIADSILTFIADLLFSSIVGVIFILFLYYANLGQIRLICIICAFLAFWVYYNTVGKLIIYFSGKVSVLLKTLIFWLCFVIIYPNCRLWRLTRRVFVKISDKIRKIRKEYENKRYSAKTIRELLYTAKYDFAKKPKLSVKRSR